MVHLKAFMIMCNFFENMKEDKEIFEQIDKASIKIESGETSSGLTYEEGVKSALLWVLGNYKNPPIFDC